MYGARINKITRYFGLLFPCYFKTIVQYSILPFTIIQHLATSRQIHWVILKNPGNDKTGVAYKEGRAEVRNIHTITLTVSAGEFIRHLQISVGHLIMKHNNKATEVIRYHRNRATWSCLQAARAGDLVHFFYIHSVSTPHMFPQRFT